MGGGAGEGGVGGGVGEGGVGVVAGEGGRCVLYILKLLYNICTST